MKKINYLYIISYDMMMWLLSRLVIIISVCLVVRFIPLEMLGILGNKLAKQIYSWATWGIIIGCLSIILLLAIEMLIRSDKNTDHKNRLERFKAAIINLFNSIKQTKAMRKFLRQYEKPIAIKTDNEKNISEGEQNDPIVDEFNNTVRKSVVDVREKDIILVIPLPKSQQARKLLKDMRSDIFEEFSIENVNYLYSSKPEYISKYLIFTGNKKQ